MKKLIIVFLFFLWKTSTASDHYFATSGNDGDPGTITQPWKTLTKLNSIFLTLVGGDHIYFNRGDTFYGKINPIKTFPAGNPLIITSYGTGVNPVISGFTDIVAWTNLGGNIWESTFSPSTLTSCNMVIIGGINVAMGRTPNSGWYTYQSFTQTTLTSTNLNSATINWTGAKAVIRKNNWITEIDTITSQAGSTIVHTFNGTTNGINNYGFFIENDVRTLDQQNEWFYNSSTKKIRIYSTSMPGTVKVSTIDTLVYTKQNDNINFDSLDFIGSNKDAIVYPGSQNIHITNCGFYFHGKDVIWCYMNLGANSASGFVFDNNIVNHVNNNVFVVATESTGGHIGDNILKNVGLQQGMAADGSDKSNGTCEVMQWKSANLICEYNKADSIGYICFQALANNVTIRYNRASHYGMTKQDGGAYYTWNGIIGAITYTSNEWYNNFALDADGLSSVAGTTQLSSLVHGFYLDANTKNKRIRNNTCANLGYGGGYNYSGSSNNLWEGNTFYNNKVNQFLLIDQRTPSTGSVPTANDTVKNNIFFSRDAGQLTGKYTTDTTTVRFLSTLGVLDSNYYARPVADNTTIQYVQKLVGTTMTLASWKTLSGKDVHSNKAPYTVSDTSKIRFIYNDTKIAKNFIMGALYDDVTGHRYGDTITLQPFTSKVLLYDTALVSLPPVVDAGIHQVITLPTNSVTLVGTASSPNMGGSIASTTWTQTVGPTSTITSPSTLTTGVTGMAVGLSFFRLQAIDNVGNTAFDTVSVLVNDSTILPPVANAGPDQSIAISTATLDGTSSSDPDGTIVAYLWTQDSGPNTAGITSPTGSTTGITGLITGTYVFRLKVTNNGGATNEDTVQIIVSIPIPPSDGSKLIIIHGNFIFTK